MWLETKIRILFVIFSILIIGIIVNVNSCSSSQELMSDNRRPTPGDMDWPTYDWQYNQHWTQHQWGNALGKVDDDDYKPASAVFFDRHEETGLCFAFYGRSFIKAPDWACKK